MDFVRFGILSKLFAHKERREILFVYGTLRKGFMNHERFEMNKQKFLGSTFVPYYKLYGIDECIPCIVFTNKISDSVFCEMYEVDVETMDFIRSIEKRAGYREAVIMTAKKTPCKGRCGSIFVYDEVPKNARPIPNGVWS